MEWDLGWQGVGMLLLISVGFGIFAHLLLWKTTTRWAGVIATFSFFVVGLLISEVWFGWATEVDLQPNIDGLSFDETLLGLIPGIAAVLLVRYWSLREDSKTTGTRRSGRPSRGAPTGGQTV